MSDDEVINGLSIDLLARALFDARSMRGTPCTDEEWERRKANPEFAATNRLLFEDARREAENG